MKAQFLTVMILVLFGSRATGQTPYTTAFAVGDVASYRYIERDDFGAIIRSSVAVRKLRLAPPFLNHDAVYDTVELSSFKGNLFTFPGLENYFPVTNLGMTVTPDGMLQTYDYSEKKWRKLFPLSPPLTDSTVIDSMRAVVTQRFDTTVFGYLVRAFRMKLTDAGSERLLTIADTFGLIRAEAMIGSEAATIELINGTIGGVKYNTETRSFDFMPICPGDVRHYRHSFIPLHDPSQQSQKNHSLSIVKDTAINGIRYYAFDPPQRYFIRDSIDGVHELDTMYRSQVFFLPSNATPGTLVGSMVVVDTTTILFWGKERRLVKLSVEAVDVGMYEEWLEGVGRVYSLSFSYFSGTDIDSLCFAKICDEEHGIALGTQSEISTGGALPLIQGVYPNPASRNVTVVVSHPDGGLIELEVFEISGRRVSLTRNLVLSHGLNAIRLDLRDIPRGKYIVCARAVSGSDSKMVIVQ